jgi:hypothetical protein
MSIISRSGFVRLLAAFALSLATSAAFAAEDPFVGTWVLNAAKSSGPPGTVPDSSTVVITDLGSGTFKSVSDNVIAGTALRTEITFAADGADYVPVTTPARPGAPAIAQSVERVNTTTYKVAVKINGEVIATVLEELSADGKTLTATTTGIGQFAGVSNVAVFDKK